jgi:HK97 family phage portal protein
MGFFRFFKKPKHIELESLLKLFRSSSDVITERDATSFAAINMICNAFASLSGSFFEASSKQAVKHHWLYDLITYPNIDETKFQFFYNCAKDYFNGNVYLYQYYNDEGILISLFRLNPAAVMVRRDPLSNEKVFYYNGETYSSATILHIPSRWGYDGLKGSSIFDECRQIFRNAAELDEYLINSFNNSIGSRIVVDFSKEIADISQEQIDQFKRLFVQNYAGVRNAGVPLIKHGKIEYSTIQSDLKDNRANQLVENRNFQERELAKIFGVPLALLNGTATADLESLYTIFIENAIRPLATSFEQAINRLIPYHERETIYFEYSYNSLLKTSLQARIDAYTKQLMNGILTPNEVRVKENLSPSDQKAGDTLFIPSNLMPLKDPQIDALLASARLKLEEANNAAFHQDHPEIGDDKA